MNEVDKEIAKQEQLRQARVSKPVVSIKDSALHNKREIEKGTQALYDQLNGGNTRKRTTQEILDMINNRDN